MLVLKRRVSEALVIGGNVRVKILAIDNNFAKPVVKIGIEAPRSISVNREEIQQRIIRNK
jgi:carbon storage regulator